MKSNNYTPRPPMPDLFATIFWLIVILAIVAKCVGVLLNRFGL